MATLTAARYSKFIRETLQSLDTTPYLCTDSQIVLYWLQNSKHINAFVTHRVIEIQQLTNHAIWNFCPISDNPADLLTWEITTSQLKSSTFWTHGPNWLTPRNDWPTWKASPILQLQAPAISSAIFTPTEDSLSVQGLHAIMDVTDYSTLHKLTAVTTSVLRIVNYVKGNCQGGQLTTTELQQAKLM